MEIFGERDIFRDQLIWSYENVRLTFDTESSTRRHSDDDQLEKKKGSWSYDRFILQQQLYPPVIWHAMLSYSITCIMNTSTAIFSTTYLLFQWNWIPTYSTDIWRNDMSDLQHLK